MPTQVIAAAITGHNDLGVGIESPRYLMADLAGANDLNAWLNSSPLPGATLSGAAETVIGRLGLGHVLTLDGGVIASGAALLSAPLRPTVSGGVSFDGSLRFSLGPQEVTGIVGGIAAGGSARLSTGAALMSLGGD